MQRLLAIEPGVSGNSGAGLRIGGLLRGLAGSFEVYRANIEEFVGDLTPRPQASEAWRFLASRPAWATTYDKGDLAKIQQRLKDRVRETEADLLWLAHGSTAAKVGLGSRSFGASIPVIVDAFDLLWTAYERRILSSTRRTQGWRRWRAALEIASARSFEHQLYAGADQVWLCSELDHQRLSQDLATDRLRVVPNFFEPPLPCGISPKVEPVQGEPPIVFVGTMGYYPNRDGVKWFLEAVWPRVIELRPQARLWVVGQWPEWERPGPAYDQAGIVVKGFIDDLDPIWSQASMLICPLQVGSGTRIKILEAWARSVPVISTSVGIEGLDAEPGVHAQVVDEAELFAKAILEFLENPRARHRIAECGQRLWQQRYTFERACQLAVEACRSLRSPECVTRTVEGSADLAMVQGGVSRPDR